ncbi:3-demethylubiquinone-9 3-methyltransferase, putative [Plasmodium ovale curtisi]|nr:3-demethylubiquinone-9 3-methyltransferase, putative [Plasmodium ovale curtisi]
MLICGGKNNVLLISPHFCDLSTKRTLMKILLGTCKRKGKQLASVYKRFYSEKTYDENEKTFFNNLYDEWWKGKQNGKDTITDIFEKVIGKNIYSLHDYNKHRFNFIFKHYEHVYYEKMKTGKNNCPFSLNILDVGCGGGILCEYMKNNIFYFLIKNEIIPSKGRYNIETGQPINVQIDGIDVSNKLIEVARRRMNKGKNEYLLRNNYWEEGENIGIYQYDNILEGEKNCGVNIRLNYKTCDVSNLANVSNEKRKKYDIIICSEVIEHVSNEKKENFVKCISLLCNPTTLVVFTTINRNFLSYLYTVVLAEYITGIIKKGTHTYDKFIDTEELNTLCTRFNLKNVSTEYVMYLPFLRSYLTTHHLKLLYLSAFVYDTHGMSGGTG